MLVGRSGSEMQLWSRGEYGNPARPKLCTKTQFDWAIRYAIKKRRFHARAVLIFQLRFPNIVSCIIFTSYMVGRQPSRFAAHAI
jgi:hypothetical protein